MDTTLKDLIELMKMCKEQRLANCIISALQIISEVQTELLHQSIHMSHETKMKLLDKIRL